MDRYKQNVAEPLRALVDPRKVNDNDNHENERMESEFNNRLEL